MLTLMFCWLTSAHAAQKRALYFGGGGQTAGEVSVFDGSIEPIAEKLKSAKYRTSVAFDGGHANLDDQLRENFADVSPFTTAEAATQISALEREINEGKVSQALIVVNSHGEPAKEGVVHAVATSESTADFDLGDLRRVQAAAKRRGVKLAIIDASCYSGQTLALAKEDPTTCVITAGSRDTTAYADFQADLVSELKNGVSLEAAYLRARKKSRGATWAQISSPAGLAASHALAQMHDDATAFEPDVRARDAGRAGLPLCLSSAARQLEVLRRTLAATPKTNRAGVTELARLYREYRDLRTAKAAEVEANAKLFTLPSGLRVSRQTLLTLDQQAPRERGREVSQFRDDLMRRVPQFRDEVTKYNASRPKWTGYESPSPTSDVDPYREVLTAADRISEAERSVYESIYHAHPKTKEPNACRDFKF